MKYRIFFSILMLSILMLCACRSGEINTTESGVLTIDTTYLPSGIIGLPYSATLKASGGSEPYTWSIVKGMLPKELSLDPNTGVISAPVTHSYADFEFTVQVTDSKGAIATQSLRILIVNSRDG